MAFLLVKRAYQDRNVHEGRAFLSAPLWQSWSQEVSTLVERHQKPVLENLNVRGMQVPTVTHGGTGDAIQVHFDYVAAVQFVEESNGHLVSGRAFDTLRCLRDLTRPLLILHGSHDEACPSWMADRMYEACGSLQKMIYRVEGGLHKDLWDRDANGMIGALHRFAGALTT